MKKKFDAMSSSDDPDAEPMSTDILKDTRDGNQYHLRISRRESHYKIRDHIKRGQA